MQQKRDVEYWFDKNLVHEINTSKCEIFRVKYTESRSSGFPESPASGSVHLLKSLALRSLFVHASMYTHKCTYVNVCVCKHQSICEKTHINRISLRLFVLFAGPFSYQRLGTYTRKAIFCAKFAGPRAWI